MWGSVETGTDECPLCCYLAAKQERLQKYPLGHWEDYCSGGLIYFLADASVLSDWNYSKIIILYTNTGWEQKGCSGEPGVSERQGFHPAVWSAAPKYPGEHSPGYFSCKSNMQLSPGQLPCTELLSTATELYLPPDPTCSNVAWPVGDTICADL